MTQIQGLRDDQLHTNDLAVPLIDSREFAYPTQRLQVESTEQLRAAIADDSEFAQGVWEQRSGLNR